MATIKVKFRKSTVSGKPGTVYYQICHRSVCRLITTDIHLQCDDWDEVNHWIRQCDAKHEVLLYSMEQKLENDVDRIHKIIRNLETLSSNYSVFDVLEAYRKNRCEESILTYMVKQIQKLKRSRRFGTAKNYQCALNSFSDFLHHIDLPFCQMNERLVHSYSDYLTEHGLTKNSISFYMRIWRCVYNKAVEEGMIEQEYPFKKVYTGISRTRKRAVDEEVIVHLMHLDLSSIPYYELSRDLFVFSYCTRGMAFIDIAYLKKSDIEGDMIVYRRRKTQQLMMVKLEPCIRYLIKKYETINQNSIYIFPLLTSEDETEKYRQYMKALSLHNMRLKKLELYLNLPVHLSSYTPRHTWATTARKHHIPVSIISAGMGHTSEKTTEIYLASLENSVIDHANSRLLKNLNELISF